MARRHTARAPKQKFKKLLKRMYLAVKQFYDGFYELSAKPAENTGYHDRVGKKKI